MSKSGDARRSVHAVLFVAVAATLAACAPTDPTVKLAATFQATLDRMYEEAQKTDGSFPGATAAFILPDGRIFSFATGFSDIEAGVKMSPDARMPSGSIGKTYVAAVAMRMALDGTLSLDDKVSKYFGEADWFDRLPNGEDMTLRMLLNHSSGLIDHAFDSAEFQECVKKAFAEGDPDVYFTPREQLEYVLDREPLFPAGKGFHYTDTGYLLAGMLMEEASGSTYYAELTKRILEPLAFKFTLPQDRLDVPGLAQGYAVTSAELYGVPSKVLKNGAFIFDPMTEWTGGGVFNNPQDLVRWGKTLFEGKAMEGGYLDDLLGSVAETERQHSESVYGLGVYILQTPFGTAYGHSGFTPGYLSVLRYFPDHGFAVAIQINTDADQPSDRIAPLIEVLVEGVGLPS